jgi:tripartite-type tricarboxylate transporter receptor subunit TctC
LSARPEIAAARRPVLAAVLSLFVSAAGAQDFPKHSITMIVPFAAGGASDVIARSVADQMGAAERRRRLLRS